jgi:Hemerythrin HHE cation binding domain
MAEISMNKAIHFAVRRDLDRFVDALARFPDGDSRRAEQLWTAWENFDLQLTDHHEGEHEIAWPALEKIGVTRDVLATMDAEHEVMAARLTEARAAMSTLRSTPTAANAMAARSAMVELQAATVQHLDHEESEIEPIYVAKSDDPVIKQMGRQFGKVSPKKGGIFFAWVTDGASAEAMQGIRGNVPGPVLSIIGGIFGRPYRRNVAPVWKA